MEVDNQVVDPSRNDDQQERPQDIAGWAESQLEDAEQADDATRLKVLKELYGALEAEIAQDLPSRR
jgi:hypothetical protein